VRKKTKMKNGRLRLLKIKTLKETTDQLRHQTITTVLYSYYIDKYSPLHPTPHLHRSHNK
jgi:hypothetical protein